MRSISHRLRINSHRLRPLITQIACKLTQIAYLNIYSDMDKKVIKKSNQFVEALYDISLWEIRLLLKMLSQIHKDDADFKTYTIDMQEVKVDFKVENDGSAYNRIRKAAKSLMKKSIVIRNRLENGSFDEVEIPIISEIGSNTVNKSFIKTSFHPKMKPYLLQLKTEFLSYDVKHVLELPTPYAIRLYEICRQYQTIGKRIIKIDDLKRMLGIEGKYKQYSHLRERILEPATRTINEMTDILLEFDTKKTGKKTDTLIFTITKKPVPQMLEKAEPKPEAEPSGKYGVSSRVYKQWQEKYSEEHIQSRVGYMNEQIAKGTEIKNKAGYLSSIMDKELKAGKKSVDITKKVNGILFSRPALQKQIEAKHGPLSQEAINAVVKKMFPDKF